MIVTILFGASLKMLRRSDLTIPRHALFASLNERGQDRFTLTAKPLSVEMTSENYGDLFLTLALTDAALTR